LLDRRVTRRPMMVTCLTTHLGFRVFSTRHPPTIQPLPLGPTPPLPLDAVPAKFPPHPTHNVARQRVPWHIFEGCTRFSMFPPKIGFVAQLTSSFFDLSRCLAVTRCLEFCLDTTDLSLVPPFPGLEGPLSGRLVYRSKVQFGLPLNKSFFFSPPPCQVTMSHFKPNFFCLSLCENSLFLQLFPWQRLSGGYRICPSLRHASPFHLALFPLWTIFSG